MKTNTKPSNKADLSVQLFWMGKDVLSVRSQIDKILALLRKESESESLDWCSEAAILHLELSLSKLIACERHLKIASRKFLDSVDGCPVRVGGKHCAQNRTITGIG